MCDLTVGRIGSPSEPVLALKIVRLLGQIEATFEAE
jgi:hypothetical protein